MLEYRDNIDYSSLSDTAPSYDMNQALAELNEIRSTGEDDYRLYLEIKKEVLKEIRLKELAITTIMPDIVEIRKKSRKKADVIESLLADPFASYSEIGKANKVSKQRVGIILKHLANDYYWLGNIITMRNSSTSHI